MVKKIARSAIHAQPQTTFSPQQANENTRDKWDRSRYDKKNEDTSHHYDFTRKKLNFIVTADGIKPLDTSNTERLHGRYIERLAELNFKAYDPTAANQPNSYIDWVFSGDHDAMAMLAFGDQEVDFSLKTSNAHIRRMPTFEHYARDVYDFACMKFGKENVIGVEAHLDETTPHVHVNVIPVAMRQQKGRASYLYVNRNDPSKTITSKQYKALNSQARKEWERSTQLERKEILAVSYSGLIGETRAERGKYLKQFHTDFFEQVGKKYGLERGRPRETLTEEEQKEVRHKTAAELEAERLEKIQELKKLDEEIAERKEVQKELKEKTGFLAKAGKKWGWGDAASNEQKVKDAETRATQAEARATQAEKDAETRATQAEARATKAEKDAQNAVNTAKKEVYDSVKEKVQKETEDKIMRDMTQISGSWTTEDKKPYVPTPKEYAENYKYYKNLTNQKTKEVESLKEEKQNLATENQKLQGQVSENNFKSRADSWLLKELLRCPDNRLWDNLQVFTNPTGWRFAGTYAGMSFNRTVPGRIEDYSMDDALLKFDFNIADSHDTALRMEIADMFLAMMAAEATPSGGGGGGGNNDLPKKKDDEEWYHNKFKGIFKAAKAKMAPSGGRRR